MCIWLFGFSPGSCRKDSAACTSDLTGANCLNLLCKLNFFDFRGSAAWVLICFWGVINTATRADRISLPLPTPEKKKKIEEEEAGVCEVKS